MKRITPACAGKSNFLCIMIYLVWDHPRMCGEKARQGSGLYLILGSPPHVRGKGRLSPTRICSKGITPACAGKRNQAYCYCS